MTPEKSREPWEERALARLRAVSEASKTIPVPTVRYELAVYVEDRHPWTIFTGATPFLVSVGDVLRTDTWRARTWPRPLASFPLRVVRVEHVISETTRPAPPAMLEIEPEAVVTTAVHHRVNVFCEEVLEAPLDARLARRARDLGEKAETEAERRAAAREDERDEAKRDEELRRSLDFRDEDERRVARGEKSRYRPIFELDPASRKLARELAAIKYDAKEHREAARTWPPKGRAQTGGGRRK